MFVFLVPLTINTQCPIDGTLKKSVDPDQMLQEMASDQYLLCLHYLKQEFLKI